MTGICATCGAPLIAVPPYLLDEWRDARNEPWGVDGHRHQPVSVPPAHCCSCPHVDYLTTSVSRHEHACTSCGASFVDPRREKRYFGRAPQ